MLMQNIKSTVDKYIRGFVLLLQYKVKNKGRVIYISPIVLGVLLVTAVLVYAYIHKQKTTPVSDEQTSSTITASSEIKKYPLTLFIPKLSIKAPIEPVRLDAEGNMDVPRNPLHASWYSAGAKPGEVGSMVLAGHLDDQKGKPALFAKITTLQEGDIVRVRNTGGTTFEYRVTKKATYPYDHAPLKEIFGETIESHLNLITCAGTWDPTSQNYATRDVVYTVLQQ